LPNGSAPGFHAEGRSSFHIEAVAADADLARKRDARREDDAMRTQPQEYSLDELLEHPALGFAMAEDGIDRQSLDLLLEGENTERRPKRPIPDEPLVE
jgi:hypothetical protein